MTKTVERADFIDAMRHVAHTVGVVTTDGIAGRYGATVSAFSSVSADPPTLLVCLHADSRISHHVSENKSFCLNVLPMSAQNLADRFAGKYDADFADRFEDLPMEDMALQMPGITHFHCTLSQSVLEGSHFICIGKVTKVAAGRGLPLTYFAGEYNALTNLEPQE